MFAIIFFPFSLKLFSIYNLHLILAANGTLSLGSRPFPGSKFSSSRWNGDKWMSFTKPTAPTQHIHVYTAQRNPCSNASHVPVLGFKTQTLKHGLTESEQEENHFVFLD